MTGEQFGHHVGDGLLGQRRAGGRAWTASAWRRSGRLRRRPPPRPWCHRHRLPIARVTVVVPRDHAARVPPEPSLGTVLILGLHDLLEGGERVLRHRGQGTARARPGWPPGRGRPTRAARAAWQTGHHWHSGGSSRGGSLVAVSHTLPRSTLPGRASGGPGRRPGWPCCARPRASASAGNRRPGRCGPASCRRPAGHWSWTDRVVLPVRFRTDRCGLDWPLAVRLAAGFRACRHLR